MIWDEWPLVCWLHGKLFHMDTVRPGLVSKEKLFQNQSSHILKLCLVAEGKRNWLHVISQICITITFRYDLQAAHI